MEKSKRITYIVAFVFIIIFVTTFFVGCNFNKPDVSDMCIRIHIRANSNSDIDQQTKLVVRDNVLADLQTRLMNSKSKSESLDILETSTEMLQNIANSTLYQLGSNYKATIRIDQEYFDEKLYDEYVFPSGIYDSLIIELGSGKGDNWWCVAFPPLCFVPSNNGGEQIEYKSWVKEILDDMF